MNTHDIKDAAVRIAGALNNADMENTKGIIAEFYGDSEENKELFNTFLYQEMEEMGWTADDIKRVIVKGCYISLQ